MIELPDNERWIAGYEGHYALADGGLTLVSYKCNRRKVRKWTKHKSGHLLTSLRMPGVPLKNLYQHQALWLWHNGALPVDKHLDHINGIPDDNRIENLREATRQENNMNKRKQSNNTSGIVGVSWEAGAKKWRAAIRIDGRKKHLGLFECKFAAQEAYNAKAKAIAQEFQREHWTSMSLDGAPGYISAKLKLNLGALSKVPTKITARGTPAENVEVEPLDFGQPGVLAAVVGEYGSVQAYAEQLSG